MSRRIAQSCWTAGVVVTVVLSWSASSRGDDDKAGELSIVPAWKVGDHQRYERVKTRRRTANGKEIANASGRGPIDVSVVEAGDKGFLVRWRIGETKADDPRGAADPNVTAMSRLVEGLEVEIELDGDATITGVRNWAKLKASAAKIADATIKAQQAAGVEGKNLAAARSTLEGMFATKGRVEQFFLREPQVLFFSIGRTYPGVGKAIEYDDHLPNPLGGAPFPCKGKFTLASYDPAKARAVVTWTQVADPKETSRILLETLKAIAERSNQPRPSADDLKTLTFADHTEFVIDTKTGWVERFAHTRSTSSQGTTQEDILTMTRLPNAATSARPKPR